MSEYKYELDRTTLFKKELNKVRKRGYDMELLNEVCFFAVNGFPKNIKIMRLRESISITENVISNLTGCLFTEFLKIR